MEILKAAFAVALAIVILGGLYIGSALLGYLLAVIAIIFVLVGMLAIFAYVIYDGLTYAFSSKKKKKTLY